MLKSLGQWTAASLPRKIIPSQLTVVSKPPSGKGKEESDTQEEVEYVSIVAKIRVTFKSCNFLALIFFLI